MTLIFTVPEYVHEDCLSEKMLTGKIRTEKGDLLYASLNVSAMHPSGWMLSDTSNICTAFHLPNKYSNANKQ